MVIKSFSGTKWWEYKNPAYRGPCFRKVSKELVELKVGYDLFIKKSKVKVKF